MWHASSPWHRLWRFDGFIVQNNVISQCRHGAWNDGGHCDSNTSPETDYTKLETESSNNLYVSRVIKQIENKTRKAYFLNITFLTEFRKDGHPSKHREPGTPVEAPQDCSHWCLPGVPDTWNEVLYAHLLSRDFKVSLKWLEFTVSLRTALALVT